jgi:hypothetical protein
LLLERSRYPTSDAMPISLTRPTWNTILGILTAGILAGCGRTETPPISGVGPGSASEEHGKTAGVQPDLVPVSTKGSEWRTADPSRQRIDSAPQTAPVLHLDPVAPSADSELTERLARLTPADRARTAFAMLPALPPGSLASVTSQAVEELRDTDYAATVLPVITNPSTHGQVLSVLFADLMERSDAVTLPALLRIARTPDHPYAPSALDNLRLLLGADHGADWAKWETAISQELTKAR